MPLDAPRFRQIIGHFATGVTVVTTAHEGWLHGMTANSITSVSLNPLLLLVCVDKSANMHAQMAKAGRFAISILTDEQENISRTFAATTEPEQNRLQGVAYRMSELGSPLIDYALAYVECDVGETFDAGDHTIYMGRVVSGSTAEDGAPLIFYRGGYRELRR